MCGSEFTLCFIVKFSSSCGSPLFFFPPTSLPHFSSSCALLSLFGVYVSSVFSQSALVIS